MFKHIPVLLNETIENLNIRNDGTYVDATLGRGGHSSAILSKLENGFLYCFDQDDQAIIESDNRLKRISSKYEIIHSNFENIRSELLLRGINQVDGVIFDLGVSSAQFDEGDRGFSYRYDAKLDMRMNRESDLTAYEVVNNYSLEDLTRIFKEYGEEKFAYQIASKIVRERMSHKIETTFELNDIIKRTLPRKVLEKKGHPSKQVFQAIRIEVNHELEALKKGLEQAINLLKPNGRICVITFNSLEDRIVKQMFAKYTYEGEGSRTLPSVQKECSYQLVFKKVILPSDSEMENNPRSKSAKLRAIERKNNEK